MRSRQLEDGALEPEFPATIGRCIYCGTTEGKLKREHIIPFGLQGPWILHEASCGRWEKVTCKVETYVLRKHLRATRAKVGMQTRRPEEVPRLWPLRIVSAGVSSDILVPIEEHPAITPIPFFPPPAYVSGAAYVGGIEAGTWSMSHHIPSVKKIRETRGASHISLPLPDEKLFARMLAKIAHSFAVACVGLESLAERYVVPAILGKTDDVGRWVGGCEEPRLPAKVWGGALAELTDGEIRVRLRVCGPMGFPPYEVIVGRVVTTESHGGAAP